MADDQVKKFYKDKKTNKMYRMTEMEAYMAKLGVDPFEVDISRAKIKPRELVEIKDVTPAMRVLFNDESDGKSK